MQNKRAHDLHAPCGIFSLVFLHAQIVVHAGNRCTWRTTVILTKRKKTQRPQIQPQVEQVLGSLVYICDICPVADLGHNLELSICKTEESRMVEWYFESCAHAWNSSCVRSPPPNSITHEGLDNHRGEGTTFDVLQSYKPFVVQIKNSLLENQRSHLYLYYHLYPIWITVGKW